MFISAFCLSHLRSQQLTMFETQLRCTHLPQLSCVHPHLLLGSVFFPHLTHWSELPRCRGQSNSRPTRNGSPSCLLDHHVSIRIYISFTLAAAIHQKMKALYDKVELLQCFQGQQAGREPSERRLNSIIQSLK